MSGRTAETQATRIARATPAVRDRVIDMLRVASLLVVVAGHWLMADIVVADGEVSAANVLTSLPGLHPLTWILQVIPLFFVAGGFANLTVWRRVRRDGGYVGYLRGRTLRLLRPVVLFAVVAQGLLGLAWLAGLADEHVALVAKLLGRPLWFLAVYLLVTAAAPVMAAWHDRAPVPALLVPMIGAVGVDAARLAGGAAGAANVNFLLVWLAAQQLGFWYADRARLVAGRSGLWAVTAAVGAALVTLTVYGPYPASMIGLPGEMSNMNPPSVCLMLLAVGQTAVVILARDRMACWLERPAVWAGVVMLGARAMTIYVWHLTALVAVVGLALFTGVDLPGGGTTWWWFSRPAWLAVLAVVLLAIVLPASRLERGQCPRAGPSLRVLVVGFLFVTAGLLGYTTTGLEPFGSVGGRLLGLHAGWLPSSLCLIGGWVLMSGQGKLMSKVRGSSVSMV